MFPDGEGHSRALAADAGRASAAPRDRRCRRLDCGDLIDGMQTIWAERCDVAAVLQPSDWPAQTRLVGYLGARHLVSRIDVSSVMTAPKEPTSLVNVFPTGVEEEKCNNYLSLFDSTALWRMGT